MKRLFLLLMMLGIGMLNSVGSTYSGSLTSTSDIGYIYDNEINYPIQALLDIGAISGSEAIGKSSYYKDRIFNKNENAQLVRDDARKWMESTVYANINDRLRTMLAEGYLTQVEYDKTNDALSVDHPEDLVMVYKIQLSLETAKRDIKRNNDIGKKIMYSEIKKGLNTLLDNSSITKMEYKNLLDSYYSDIFISLKNPTDVFKKFKEAHGAIYGTLRVYLTSNKGTTYFIDEVTKEDALIQCKTNNPEKYNSVRCTWKGDELYSYGSIPVIYTNDSANNNPYFTQIKSQLGDRLSTMSIEKLESSLKRNKFIERRYKQGSKNKIKVQAIIILLEEEIRSRVDDDLDIDSLLAP